MNALTIGASKIHQIDGLYSLNDLHKAAGGEAKYRPAYFLNNEQTKSLIEEISNAGIPAFKTQRGANGGTYACRELVIAYAAWISPSFHLKVIRVFLEAISPPAALPALAFDWKAEIDAANFDLQEPLPPEVQEAIAARAWALTRGVQQLLERHLTRRVAGNSKRAAAILESATLEEAITPFHHQEAGTVLTIMDAMINVAINARREMRDLAQRKTKPWTNS